MVAGFAFHPSIFSGLGAPHGYVSASVLLTDQMVVEQSLFLEIRFLGGSILERDCSLVAGIESLQAVHC